ncbi:hypothetical protein BY458DRAFT_477407 [Sporodiniella umbellata]|nr:hypothetical protein BY458DRAFT_477407 [Sporodiniella umbellata]
MATYTSDTDTFQAPYTSQSKSIDSLLEPIQNTSASNAGDDYVQNLSEELQNTKDLLQKYQLRSEQLMELVQKQTDKIADLREQLKATEQQ